MHELPSGLSPSFGESFKGSAEDKVVEYLDNHPSELMQIIQAISGDIAWAEAQENWHLEREVIRILLKHDAIDDATIQKILEITETSKVFGDLFEKEIEKSPTLLLRCLKILEESQAWIVEHPAAAKLILKDFIQIHLKKASSSTQQRMARLSESIRNLALFNAPEDLELLRKAIQSGDTSSVKLLLEQGVLQSIKAQEAQHLFKDTILYSQFDILCLLYAHGLRFQGDGSQELESAISAYYNQEKNSYSFSSEAERLNKKVNVENAEKIALFLAANGAILKRKDSSSYSSSKYPHDRSSVETYIIRNKLHEVAKIYQNNARRGAQKIYIPSNPELFATWLLHYQDVSSWLKQNTEALPELFRAIAASSSNVAELLALLERENILSDDNYQILFQAAIDAQYPSLLSILCEKRGIPEELTKNKCSPIEYALKSNRLISVLKLLHYGRNSNARNPTTNQSLIAYAVSQLGSSNASELIELCINCGIDFEHLQSSEILAIWKKMIPPRDRDSTYLLCQLIDAGLPFLEIYDQKTGDTPLLMALKAKTFDVAEKLMAMGARSQLINARNKAGESPLSIALRDCNDKLAQLLIDDGADISLLSDLEQQEARVFLPKTQEIKDPQTALRELSSTHILANFVGDSFIKGMTDERGQDIEGNPFNESLKYFNTLLNRLLHEIDIDQNAKELILKEDQTKASLLTFKQKMEQCGKYAELFAVIRSAPEDRKKELVKALSFRISHAIQALKPGESLLLPSGWTSAKGGHAMLCEISCAERGQYTCTSINTGDGAKHHAFVVGGAKTYIHPFCKYAGLSLGDVSDATFLQALIEPQIQPSKKDEAYSAKDIYDGIFARFKDHLAPVSLELSEYITGQRAGTCSIRVLLAYMHLLLGEDAYKTSHHYLKKLALAAGLPEDLSSLENQPTHSHILQKGAESFCRSILGMTKTEKGEITLLEGHWKLTLRDILDIFASEGIDPQHIPDEMGERTLVAICKKLNARVKERIPANMIAKEPRINDREAVESFLLALKILGATESALVEKVSAHPEIYTPEALPVKTETLTATINTIASEMKGFNASASTASRESAQAPGLPLIPENLRQEAPETLISVIGEVEKYCAYYRNGSRVEQESAVHLFTKLMNELPLSSSAEDLWNHLGDPHTEIVLKNLHSLAIAFTSCMQASPIAFPERIIAIYKAQAIAFKLAIQMERTLHPDKSIKLEQFGMNFTPLFNLHNNIHNVIYDAKTKKNLDDLIEYLKLAHPAPENKARTLFDYASWATDYGMIELPIPAVSAEHHYLSEWAEGIQESAWGRIDQHYAEQGYKFQSQVSLQEWRLAHFWIGSTDKLPSYFGYLRDFSLFSNLLTKTSSDRWDNLKNYRDNQPLFSLSVGEKKLQIRAASTSTTLNYIYADTTPADVTAPQNSYPSTHFPVKDAQKQKALKSLSDQNAYMLQQQHSLEPFLSITSKPSLTAHHIRSWIASHTNDLIERDNQTFVQLALFCNKRLLSSLQEEPSLGKNFLETIDAKLAEFGLMLTESAQTKAQAKEGTSTQEQLAEQEKLAKTQLFLFQLRLRVLAKIQEANQTTDTGIDVNEEVAKVRNDLENLFSSSMSSAVMKDPKMQRSARLTWVSSFYFFPPTRVQEGMKIIEHLWHGQFYSDFASETDPSVEFQAKSVFYQHDLLLSAQLAPADVHIRLFRGIARNLYGIPLSSAAIWKFSSPICTCADKGHLYEFNLATSVLKRDGIVLNDMATIYEHPHFIHAFQSQRFQSSTVTVISNEYQKYEVFDEKGQSIRFYLSTAKKDVADMRIEKEMDGDDYVFVPWEKVPAYPAFPPLPKQPNRESYVLWMSKSDESIRVIDRQNQKLVCTVYPDGGMSGPSRDTEYDWIDIERTPELQSLLQFEQPQQILALQSKDQNELHIQFCRYKDPKGANLSFSKKNVERVEKGVKTTSLQLVWDHDPQYFISSSQQVAGLPGFHQFLVLENAKGEKKVLIPQKVHSTTIDAAFTGPPYSFACEFIDLGKDGRLAPKTPPQYIFAAYLSLMHRKYETASAYLDKAYSLKRYSPNELKSLGWILHSLEENEDHDPNAFAVRSYAAWLIQNNLFRNPTSESAAGLPSTVKNLYQEASDWEMYLEGKGYWRTAPTEQEPAYAHTVNEAVGVMYCRYLNVRKNVHAHLRLDISKGKREAKLRPYNEINWLQNLLKKLPNSQLAARLESLVEEENSGLKAFAPRPHIDAPEARLYAFGKSQPQRYSYSYQTTYTSPPLGVQTISNPSQAVEIIKDIFPRTRPGEEFSKNFLNFYLLATTGHESHKKILLHLLYDMRHEPSPLNQALRAILEAIILNRPAAVRMKTLVNNLMPGHLQDTHPDLEKLNELIQDYLKTSYQSADKLHPYDIDMSIKTKVLADRVPTLSPPPKSLPPPEDFVKLSIPPENRLNYLKKNNVGRDGFIKQQTPREHEPFPEGRQQSAYAKERHQKQIEDYHEGCKKNDLAPFYHFTEAADFRKWKTELEADELQEASANVELYEKILSFAQKVTPVDESRTAHLSERLKRHGRKRAPITFSALLAAFAQESRTGYRKLNPALKDTEIDQLHQWIGTYLANSIDYRNNQHKVALLDKLLTQIEEKENPTLIEDTLQELGELLDQKSTEEAATFTISSQEATRREDADVKDRDVGIAPAISEERSLTDALHSQSIPDEIVKVAGKTMQSAPLLTFEYVMEMGVREDQVEDIKELLGITSLDQRYQMIAAKNSFRQKLMGRGKTIVLGTLLSLLKADGYHLSILIPPTSLSETTAQDMQIRSQRLFGQKTHTIVFRRDPAFFNTVYLANCYEILHGAIVNRDSVILPPECLQAMENQYWEVRKELKSLYQVQNHYKEQEALLSISDKRQLESIERRITALQRPNHILKEILKLINTRAIFTFDEVDITLSVLKELNFPVGEPLSVPKSTNELLAELYLVAATDPEILNCGLDLRSNNQTALTDKNYQEVKKILAEKMFSRLKTSKKWSEQLFLNEASFNEYGKERLLAEIQAYISDLDAPLPDFIDKLHDSNQPLKVEAAELFVLLRQELNEWLKDNWKKSAGVDYGFSLMNPKRLIAIPFSANTKPNEKALFFDPWKTINTTLQLYLHTGLREDQIIEFIEGLQKRVRSEWVQAGYPKDVKQMPTAQLFLEITGLDLLSIHRGQTEIIKNVQQLIRNGGEPATRLMLDYVVDHVLPQVKVYPEQISHDSQNLASMPSAKEGYSGTMENVDSFPEDVEVVLDKGTNGQIIDVLLRENKAVHVVEGSRILEHLKQVLGWPKLIHPHARQFHALVDLGPIYKGQSSEQQARDILAFMQDHPEESLKHIKGVLYWDDITNLLCCIKQGDPEPIVLPASDSDTIYSITGLKNEELFAFYPHHKLTGANLPLPRDAYVLTTFSENTPLRDELQGDARARGIFKNQHVEAIVQKSTLPLIGDQIGRPDLAEKITTTSPDPSELSRADLLPFAEANESKNQEAALPYSYIKIMNNHAREYIKQETYRAETDAEENAHFERGEHLIVRRQSLSLFDRLAHQRREVSTEVFFVNKADQIVMPLGKYRLREVISADGELLPPSQELPIELLKTYQRIHATIKTALTKLPPTLANTGSLEWNMETTIEMQMETAVQLEQLQEIEYQIELETLQQSKEDSTPAQEKPWTTEHLDDIASTGLITSAYPMQLSSHPAIWGIKDILFNHPHMHKYAKCFSDGLYITENFLRTVENTDNLFDDMQKPIYEVLAVYDPKNEPAWKLYILSIAEAAFYKQQLAEKTLRNPPMWLLEPDGTMIQSGVHEMQVLGKNALMDLDAALIPLLFLSGNVKSLNSNKWIDGFTNWVQSHTSEKRELFETAILDDLGGEKRQYYHFSRVETILNQIAYELAPEEEVSVLPKRLNLAKIAVANRLTAVCLQQLDKALKSADLSNPEEIASVIQITAMVLTKSKKVEEKKAAKVHLVSVMNRALQLTGNSLALSAETLLFLKGIHDPEIAQLVSSITLKLIEESHFELATEIALSQIPSFKFTQEEFAKYSASIEHLRILTLQILSALGEKGRVNEIKRIESTLLKAVDYFESAIIHRSLLSFIATQPGKYRGLEKISERAFEPYYRNADNLIADIYFNRQKKDKKLSEIVEEIQETFLSHGNNFPSITLMGIKLLQKIADSTKDYYSKLPKLSSLPLLFALYETNNPYAMRISQQMLKAFMEKSIEWSQASLDLQQRIEEIVEIKIYL